MSVSPLPRPGASTGVFDDANAAQLSAADTTHWWFRGKSEVVGAVLRRWAPAEGWLVDVGAGSGGVTSMIPWEGSRRLVVEGSSPLVQSAGGRGLAATQGSVLSLPLRDRVASAVCLLDVIEHLPDPVAALEEARRVVSGDGVVVVSAPAHMWLWSATDVALGHHRRYTRRLLHTQVVAAGLEPLWISHAFCWCAAPVWLARKACRGAEADLGISEASPALNRLADLLNRAERSVLGRTTVPIGTSVLAVARRASP